MNHSDIVKIFKALCDERRIEILEQLQDGEKCACKLLEQMDISQATLSHHMKILCDSGLVHGRKDGKWMHYSFDRIGCEKAKEILEIIFSTQENSNSTSSCCNKR